MRSPGAAVSFAIFYINKNIHINQEIV